MTDMPTDTLTYERALALLNEAVELKGAEYVYQRADRGEACLYAEYDAANLPVGPSCIVGHALVSFGVPLNAFAPHEGSGVGTLVRVFGLTVEPKAVDLFMEAQGAQDCGTPWAESVTGAVEEVARTDYAEDDE